MRILLLAFIVLFLTAVSAVAQCPLITVIGPAGVTNPGDEMKFSLEVTPAFSNLSYRWTVSAGTIVDGEGTPTLTVATDRSLGGAVVTVTVEIEGLPNGCEKVRSETGPVASTLDSEWGLDEFGALGPAEKRLRLDVFFTELANNPDNRGLVVLRIKPNERRDITNRRVQFILKHAKYRRFDQRRLWFALEPSDHEVTIPVKIPPGADMPPCKNCVIIKINEPPK